MSVGHFLHVSQEDNIEMDIMKISCGEVKLISA
jgi:hypothetical protein